ncbi:methyltransferase domain-containing protein [Methyloligella sp. 2.7D]|uniref:methyltransferase domain-containing protein n=1 Tax=unclassified Methyloligella TaxID=2625955 RepID=UPI00157C9239|nr:methyltransferase domain-containing protein [Methyloligella sp. GL2]QKP77213.1 methyltransferase domain-containing protein [Methyloligella sp. GL2]
MKHEAVQDYYGKTLQSSGDLKTSACCDGAGVPAVLRPLLSNIHPEVTEKYYGCGVTVPAALDGARVLDLGSGSGRDCYLIAQLVGPSGAVVGIDMTDEQLAVANAHIDWHTAKFGFDAPNIGFRKGYIEELGALGLPPQSFDVIVSNCVINLSTDKPAVLKGAFDLLKPGGELYFADVYCDRRLPKTVRNDPLLYGECLGGALYWGDFLGIAKGAGFADPRLVDSRPLEIEDPAIAAKLGNARFFSATYRLFKIQDLEASCEDYGQAVIYRGGVAEQPDRFVLDAHHAIERGKVFPVCGNTWHMLKQSRFAPFFEFIGDFATHYGIFEGCGTQMPFAEGVAVAGSDSSCC